MLYLIFLTVIFNLATASLPPLSPQRYIHRTVFTFQATRFCGAGCCWLPAAGAPPPSQLRTEAEAKREREGERTDGGRIVHLWGRETMTNRSKTETTKRIQQRVKDKDVIFIEDTMTLWSLHFSPIKVHLNLEFILNKFYKRKLFLTWNKSLAILNMFKLGLIFWK